MFFRIIVTIFSLFILVLSKGHGHGVTGTICYLGHMPPRLCQKHLAGYPTTHARYAELRSFLDLIPFVDKTRVTCSECPSCHEMILTKDVVSLWNSYRCPACKAYINKEQWKFCDGPLMNSGYFQNCNELYFPFFTLFLQYCSENPECKCYWPEYQDTAAYINQTAMYLVSFLEGWSLLFNDFSPYWSKDFIHKRESLATHAFFYSQHHQICQDLAKYVNRIGVDPQRASKGLNKIAESLDIRASEFLKLYTQCLKKHPHPKIYYERGLIYMDRGNSEEVLKNIKHLIELAKLSDDIIISSEMYQQEGTAYADLGVYDKAVDALNRAILKDPKNKEAYFQRATSYFELGDFENSLEDYLHLKASDYSIPYYLAPQDFIEGFSQAAIKGAREACCDFVPSLCHTVFGLGKCLWAFGTQPLDCVRDLACASYEMADHVVAYLKTVDKDTLHDYVDELVKLYKNFNKLSEPEKGKLIGYALGKYGVDIFAGAAAIKGVSAYKKLKKAQQICNFESMAESEVSKEGVISKGLQQNAERSLFFASTTIHWDSQNKHVIGRHNYREGSSVFQHEDAEGLLKQHAGGGTPLRGNMGSPGYKEIVDFKEHVGIWVSEDRLQKLPTTKGTIHYSKKGAHIVPAHPEAKIW